MKKVTLLHYLKTIPHKRKYDCFLSIFFLIFSIFSILYLFCSGFIFNALYTIAFLIIPFAIFIVEWAFNIKFPSPLITCFLTVACGAILGSSFEFYNKFLWFDDFLHTLSGFMFACFGFVLANLFIQNTDSKKNFIGCLFVGACFSLSVGLLWELFEYGCSILVGTDMQEDSLITYIHSYFLSGTHKEYVNISDISHTIIFYGNNKNILIENGYLDIGLYDTLNDMFVCLIGTVAYTLLFIFTRWKCKYVYNLFCPKINASKE